MFLIGLVVILCISLESNLLQIKLCGIIKFSKINLIITLNVFLIRDLGFGGNGILSIMKGLMNLKNIHSNLIGEFFFIYLFCFFCVYFCFGKNYLFVLFYLCIYL